MTVRRLAHAHALPTSQHPTPLLQPHTARLLKGRAAQARLVLLFPNDDEPRYHSLQPRLRSTPYHNIHHAVAVAALSSDLCQRWPHALQLRYRGPSRSRQRGVAAPPTPPCSMILRRHQAAQCASEICLPARLPPPRRQPRPTHPSRSCYPYQESCASVSTPLRWCLRTLSGGQIKRPCDTMSVSAFYSQTSRSTTRA